MNPLNLSEIKCYYDENHNKINKSINKIDNDIL